LGLIRSHDQFSRLGGGGFSREKPTKQEGYFQRKVDLEDTSEFRGEGSTAHFGKECQIKNRHKRFECFRVGTLEEHQTGIFHGLKGKKEPAEKVSSYPPLEGCGNLPGGKTYNDVKSSGEKQLKKGDLTFLIRGRGGGHRLNSREVIDICRSKIHCNRGEPFRSLQERVVERRLWLRRRGGPNRERRRAAISYTT